MRKTIPVVTIGFAIVVLSGVFFNAQGFGTFYTTAVGSSSSGMRIESCGTAASGNAEAASGNIQEQSSSDNLSGVQLHIVSCDTCTVDTAMLDLTYIADYFLFSKSMEDFFRNNYDQETFYVEMISYGEDRGDWFINVYSEPVTGGDYVIPVMAITKDTVRMNVVDTIDGKEEIAKSRLYSRYDYEVIETSKYVRSLTIDEIPDTNNRQTEFLESAYPGLSSITMMETIDELTQESVYQGFDGTHTLPIFEYNADYFVVYDVETLNGKDRVVASTVWERIGPLAEIYSFVCHIESSEEKLKTVKKKLSSEAGITSEMWEFYDNVTSGDKKVWVQFITYSDQENLEFDTAEAFRIFNYGYDLPVVIVQSNGDVGIQQISFKDNRETVPFYRSWRLVNEEYVMDPIWGWADWDNRENIPYFQEFTYEFPFE